MSSGIEIRIVDPDDDYLGLDISAGSGRFFGSARGYAGVEQLSEFSRALKGFPSSPDDKRTYEFGTRFPAFAGGFVKFSFRCQDQAGHPEVEVEINDDAEFHSKASASFSFPFEAASLDRFLSALPTLEKAKNGHVTLSPAA